MGVKMRMARGWGTMQNSIDSDIIVYYAIRKNVFLLIICSFKCIDTDIKMIE